jgi:hypothetical protein
VSEVQFESVRKQWHPWCSNEEQNVYQQEELKWAQVPGAPSVQMVSRQNAGPRNQRPCRAKDLAVQIDDVIRKVRKVGTKRVVFGARGGLPAIRAVATEPR